MQILIATEFAFLEQSCVYKEPCPWKRRELGHGAAGDSRDQIFGLSRFASRAGFMARLMQAFAWRLSRESSPACKNFGFVHLPTSINDQFLEHIFMAGKAEKSNVMRILIRQRKSSIRRIPSGCAGGRSTRAERPRRWNTSKLRRGRQNPVILVGSDAVRRRSSKKLHMSSTRRARAARFGRFS